MSDLHTWRQATNPDRTVQAVYFVGWPIDGDALTFWITQREFDWYREAGKVVIRPDGPDEEVVVRPGTWLVFDLAHPRRACRVQVWGNYEFLRWYRLDLGAAAA